MSQMLVFKSVEVTDLSERIATAVKTDGRSVQVISTAAQMSDATLYNLINGVNKKVDVQKIQRLESVLGIDLGVKFED